MLKTIFLLFLVLLASMVHAQNAGIGTPFISNYEKADIGIESINKAVVQDSRGIMYFANEFGILEYDGKNWEIIQTSSNKSSITSLAIDKNDRIYAGAQGDLGYLDYHPEYNLIFRSLVDKIPEQDREFGNIWQTYVSQKGVFFYSWDGIFYYNNDTIKTIKIPGLSEGCFYVRDTIYIQSNEGLYSLKDLVPVKTILSDFFADKHVTLMLPHGKNSILIGTLKSGLFIVSDNNIKPWDFDENFMLREGILLKNGNYAFLTSHAGVIFTNTEGKILKHLTKKDGLQTNNISSIKSDMLGNLWLGSNGLDYVEIASPFTKQQIKTDERIAVYASIVYKDKLYLATHSGVYYMPWNNSINAAETVFNKVLGIPEINWNLQVINGVLIASTELGFYKIKDNTASLITKTHGAWYAQQVPERPDLLIGSTYKGLVLLQQSNDSIHLLKTLDGFSESGRLLEFDNENNLWVCHGYKGAFKISFNQKYDEIVNVSFYDTQKGFPSKLYIAAHKINNDLVFSSQKGFYTYDSKNDTIVEYSDLASKISQTEHVRFLKQNENRTWFIHGSTTGFLDYFPDGTFSKQTSIFNKINDYYIPGFENINTIENNDAIFGTKDGLIIYSSDISGNNDKPFKVLLRKVSNTLSSKVLYDDRLQYLCDTILYPNAKVLFKHNNFIFDFAASFYENPESIEYSYYLEGYDKTWSEWNTKNQKEYTNLYEGTYIFRIKARNIYNTISEEENYTFTILPPWFRTYWAYFSYIIMVFFFFALTLLWRNQQIKKEKEKFIAEQKKQQEFEKAKYNEEKLTYELENKNKELASLASNVIYKNERITEIKNRLEELTPIAAEKVSKKLTLVLKYIEEELEDDNWENFEYRFNQAHNNFIKRFKTAFPELTPKDLKFCAYLRMNLNTKEIAQLLNMTTRGVENARYRIRGRLGLDTNSSLASFIITF